MRDKAAFLACWVSFAGLACGPTTTEVTSGQRLSPSAVPLSGSGTGAVGRDLSPSEMQEKLAASRATWKARLASRGPRYSYQRSFESWTGYGYVTTVIVEGGVVVERRYEERNRGTASTSDPGKTWVETGAAVGSHGEGERALTIDALYDKCAETLRKLDLGRSQMFFRLDSGGLLAQCQTVDKGCADDCAVGVSIDWVQIGN